MPICTTCTVISAVGEAPVTEGAFLLFFPAAAAAADILNNDGQESGDQER